MIVDADILPRFAMGSVETYGDDRVEKHAHPGIEQFFFNFEESNMIVMIDDPQGAFYGSQVAAPIFRDTLQQILVAKGIQPISGEGLPSFEQLEQAEAKMVQSEKKVPQLTLMPDGKIKLPDFKGVDMRHAAGIIRQGRLRLKPHGSGFAYKQEPKAGSVVNEGETIEIWFK